MHISYWAPFFDKIATVKSVKNSIRSLLLFEKDIKKIDLINFFDEWSENKITNIDNKNLNYISFYNKRIVNILPKNSFIKSRFSYFMLFLLGAFPLIKYLKISKPNYLLVHLISSLPLTILILFNFKTKFILRVSGLPKLTLFRRLLWKISNKKIFKVIVPTQATLDTLRKEKIFDENKLFLVRDPVIEIKNIKKKLKDNSIKLNNFFFFFFFFFLQKNH